MELTKNEKSIIKHLSSLKIVSIIITIFGILSLLLGLYSTFFRYRRWSQKFGQCVKL